jgi:hypothetical protein
LALILRHEVAAEGFSNVRTAVGDAAVWVEIENPTYLSNAKAMGRALRAVCSLVPPRIEWIYISLKHRDIIMLTMKLGRRDFEAYIDERLDSSTLLNFTKFDNFGNEQREVFQQQELGVTALTESYGAKKLHFAVLPRLNTYFNDYSAGVIKYNFALLGTAAYLPWTGGFFTTIFSVSLFNNIPSSFSSVISEPEKDPVRSDTIEYLSNTDPRLETLAFDQLFNMPKEWLGRASVGLFETAYGGIGLECFRFFDQGHWGLGLETEWVKKRALDNNFQFRENSPLQKTAFLNIYYKLVPKLGLDVGLKLGRFLAGDWGGRLDISRTYRYFTMGAWYTATDTGNFTASFNKGYHDKGVYLMVPFSVFKDHDNPLRLLYSFRPWGRDTGRTVDQVNTLYPMADTNATIGNIGNIDSFRRQLEELKD